MIKYRPQRGGLDEAMSEMKVFENIADLLDYIVEDWQGYIKIEDICFSKSYGLDGRINWKSWRYVCVSRIGDENYISKYNTPQAIGMVDFGERG